MPTLPYIPGTSQPINHDFARQVVEYLQALTPGTSSTLRTSFLAGGTTHEVIPSPGGSTEKPKPFELRMTKQGNNDKVRVYPSLIGGVRPSGFSDDDDTNPFLLTPVDSGLVYGQADVNSNGSVSSASLHINTTVPASNPSGGVICTPAIGIVTRKDGVWKCVNYYYGPINFVWCGSAVYFY